MTIHRARMQRQGRDRKQSVRFFVTLGLITLLLMFILYWIFV